MLTGLLLTAIASLLGLIAYLASRLRGVERSLADVEQALVEAECSLDEVETSLEEAVLSLDEWEDKASQAVAKSLQHLLEHRDRLAEADAIEIALPIGRRMVRIRGDWRSPQQRIEAARHQLEQSWRQTHDDGDLPASDAN